MPIGWKSRPLVNADAFLLTNRDSEAFFRFQVSGFRFQGSGFRVQGERTFLASNIIYLIYKLLRSKAFCGKTFSLSPGTKARKKIIYSLCLPAIGFVLGEAGGS